MPVFAITCLGQKLLHIRNSPAAIYLPRFLTPEEFYNEVWPKTKKILQIQLTLIPVETKNEAFLSIYLESLLSPLS